jgi:hypothetical protein
MRILLWHVHGAWTTAFVQGSHSYLLPVLPDRGPNGRGRAQTYSWPDNVVEVPVDRLANADIDVVILQRPEELRLAAHWLRRIPGRDLPAVYVEHNTPRGDVPDTWHPVADRDDIVLVHVTHFNQLFWQSGSTLSAVIEHGVPEPAARYTGELDRMAVAVNEPIRRWRVTGTDLLPQFAAIGGLDVFGMRTAGLAEALGCPVTVFDDPDQARMHALIAQRRMYVHPMRWTSLGLSLLEAMMIGMPVVALATTEAIEALPPDAGVLSTQVQVLVEAARWLLDDPSAARAMGDRARQAALRRYGLDRFLADWDHLLKEVQAR